MSAAHAKLTDWQKEALARNSDDSLTQIEQNIAVRQDFNKALVGVSFEERKGKVESYNRSLELKNNVHPL